jgi:hypothetical protein
MKYIVFLEIDPCVEKLCSYHFRKEEKMSVFASSEEEAKRIAVKDCYPHHTETPCYRAVRCVEYESYWDSQFSFTSK